MRYLFVTFDGGGNLLPELALAGRLRDRGHDVRFLGHPSQHAAVKDAGFAFSAYQHVPAYDCTERDATPIKDWTGEEPSKVFASIRDHLIFGPAALFAADVAAELDRHPVDALAVDFFLFGALAAAEKSGLPTAVLWHTVHAPGAWWKEGLPTLNVVRAGIGLPPLGDVFEQYRRVDRVLVLTSKAFDFAITDSELPANVRHVGPQVSMPRSGTAAPGGAISGRSCWPASAPPTRRRTSCCAVSRPAERSQSGRSSRPVPPSGWTVSCQPTSRSATGYRTTRCCRTQRSLSPTPAWEP